MAISPSAVPALVTLEDSTIYNAGVHALVSTSIDAQFSPPVAASMFTFWDHSITFGQEVLLRHILSFLGTSQKCFLG